MRERRRHDQQTYRHPMDLRELDDVAVLLRTHGIQELANHLDAIREDLRPSPVRKLKKKWARHSTERPAFQA